MRCSDVAATLLLCLSFAACGGDEAPEPSGSLFDVRPIGDTSGSDTRSDADGTGDADATSTEDTTQDGSGSGDEGLHDRPGASPCMRDSDCVGGHCIRSERFPDGYCTISDCDTVNRCERGELCANVDGALLCAAQCVANDDCPDGFRCEFVAGPTRAACLPMPPVVRKDDGEPCTASEECAGGTCLADPEFPSGYCTTEGCRAEFDCAREDSDNRCYALDGTNRCYRTCLSASSPCRAGYTCTLAPGGSAYCAPTSIEIPAPEPTDPSPFPTVCGIAEAGVDLVLNFEVAPGSASFLATAFSESGALDLHTLSLPSGRVVNLDTAEPLLTVGESFFRQVVPLYLPQYPAVASLVESGSYALSLSSSSRQACVRLLDAPGTGSQLHLRVHLVGLDITPEQAPSDPRLAAMFGEVDRIFAAAGISLGTVTFHTLEPRDDAAYAIVRSFGEVQRMVKLAQQPAPGEQERSLNIFLNRGFAFASGPVIGISAGIPGAAGLYGSEASGLAFTTEYLGTSVDARQGQVDGNLFTGLVMAHEIGHYLGLFHVIETAGGEDPLSDTDNCRSYDTSCAASLNLMHPFAWGDNSVLSPQQQRILNLHPILTAP